MNNIIALLSKKGSLTLKEFNEYMEKAYDERILKNADYYSFFVNLCQKEKYNLGGNEMDNETFLDGILKEAYEGKDILKFELEKQQAQMLEIGDNLEVSDILIKKVS